MSSRVCATHIAALAALLFLVPPAPFIRGQEARFHSSPWRSRATVVVPFELINGEIVMRLSLNGAAPANFLLDSGSGPSQFDRRAIATAHLKTVSVGNTKEITPAGTLPLTLAANGFRLTYGRSEIVHGSAFVTDLSTFEQALGIPLAGIVGFDYMQQCPILLDYRARTITIFKDRKVRYRGPGIAVPVETAQPSGELLHVPVVVARLELNDRSQVSARLEIDTGSNHALTLHAPFLRQHDLARHEAVQGPAAAPIFSETFGGVRYQLERGQISAVEIGGLKIPDPEALYAKNPAGVSASDQTDGELGSQFLSQFRIFFDIPRHLIVFEQRAGPESPQVAQ